MGASGNRCASAAGAPGAPRSFPRALASRRTHCRTSLALAAGAASWRPGDLAAAGACALPGPRLSPRPNKSLPGADVPSPAVPGLRSQSKHQAVALARPRVLAAREAESGGGDLERRARGAAAAGRRPVAGRTPRSARGPPAPGLPGSLRSLLAFGAHCIPSASSPCSPEREPLGDSGGLPPAGSAPTPRP